MRGAWNEEYDAWEGTSLLLTKEGVWDEHSCPKHCPHYEHAFAVAQATGHLLECFWDAEGYSWIYRIPIPYATFEIVEEGEPYCRGIVFSLADVI